MTRRGFPHLPRLLASNRQDLRFALSATGKFLYYPPTFPVRQSLAMRLRATDSKNALVDDPLPHRTSTPRLRCWHVGLCAVVVLGCCLRARAQSAGEDFKSYPLRYKFAADVEKMLAELLPNAGGETQLSIDARNNRLLVRGSEKTQA